MVERLHHTGRIETTYGSQRLRPVAREKRRERRKDDEPPDRASPLADSSREEDTLSGDPASADADPAVTEPTGKHIDVVI